MRSKLPIRTGPVKDGAVRGVGFWRGVAVGKFDPSNRIFIAIFLRTMSPTIHRKTKRATTPNAINAIREYAALGGGGGCGSVGGSKGTGSGRMRSEHGRSLTNVCVKTGGCDGCGAFLALTIRRSISLYISIRLLSCFYID